MKTQYSLKTIKNSEGKISREYRGTIRIKGRLASFDGPYFPEISEPIEKQHDQLLERDKNRKEITTIITEEY